ncbi:hypothetical protein G7Y79_00004g013270 [Physcia stellaris]|nr:hypothetical protein G7Y79_00004g013270 [Physcia stellaris]
MMARQNPSDMEKAACPRSENLPDDNGMIEGISEVASLYSPRALDRCRLPSDKVGNSDSNKCTAATPRKTQVEDFQSGYPQFSALIGSHSSFQVWRRFLRVRARLLLYKQDELSVLEKQLDQIDNEETRDLFLGNRRRDRNLQRAEIVTKLEKTLRNYDKFLYTSREALDSGTASRKDITNLQNWVENTSNIARDETAYLSHSEDLMTLHCPPDDTMARLTPLIERAICSLYRLFGKPQSEISRDNNISLLSVSLLQKITRGLIAWLVVLSLLVPIVILNALTSTALRLMVIVLASAFLIAAIAGLTKAKTVEVFVSGAT